MTRTPPGSTPKSEDNAALLHELQDKVEDGELNVQLISDYIMFCELGGTATQYMKEKVQFAIEYCKAQEETSQSEPTISTPSESTYTRSEYSNSSTYSPRQARASGGTTIDSTLVRDVANTIADTVSKMAIGYWQIRSLEAQIRLADTQSRVAEQRYEAARAREDERAASARWQQLGIWSFVTAGKALVDIMTSRPPPKQ
jgi:hypothetical protein